YEEEVNIFSTLRFGDDPAMSKQGVQARVCGIITSIRKRYDKRERPIAFIELEDFTGKGECIFWAEAYKNNEKYLQPDSIVMVVGKTDTNGETVKVVADEVCSINAARDKFTRGVMLSLREDEMTAEKLQKLKSVLEKNKGNCQCYLSVLNGSSANSRRFLARKFTVSPTSDALRSLRAVLGETNVRIIA
ncbi:MAG TPA: OB-fold nucleic acid binding domain-containing protein, partial [Candidatus Kapabacteria bacterium]|nr:OB-fold nucleic acid binding domain-containing protein [Candidatus Kapabacteria bacterium]